MKNSHLLKLWPTYYSQQEIATVFSNHIVRNIDNISCDFRLREEVDIIFSRSTECVRIYAS